MGLLINNNNQTNARVPPTIRLPQREIEAVLGTALLTTAGTLSKNIGLKKTKLVEKQVYLPKCDYTMHYLERKAVEVDESSQQPTLLFFHGISQRCTDYADFVNKLDIPSNIRILVPEQAGHGSDIERARLEGPAYVQPTQESMLATTSEFLDQVHASNNCNVFGISLGGAVAYYLHNKRPDKIQRAMLVCPAIPACVDKDLAKGIVNGTNNFFCFESRNDVKLLFRDLSTGQNDNERKKKDPVPKFFNEAIYRMSKKASPDGHYMGLLNSLLKNTPTLNDDNYDAESDGSSERRRSITNPFAAVSDINGDANRLVIWPQKDQIINYEQGRQFFEATISNGDSKTQFETIPDCGHVFHSDGTGIFEIIRPRTREYLLEFSEK